MLDRKVYMRNWRKLNPEKDRSYKRSGLPRKIRPQASCHPDRQHRAHGLCSPCYQKAVASTPEGKEKSRRRQANWKKRNKHRLPVLYRDQNLKKKLGIGLEQYNKLYENQKGVCAICKEHHPDHGWNGLNVDHDHRNGKIRSLLCRNCNVMLGASRERPDLLLAATEYLKKHDDR